MLFVNVGESAMRTRYEMRKFGGTWLVWDRQREKVVDVDGKLAIGLTAEFAADLVKLMNGLEEMFD
jgi:hypothetical protein